MSQDAQLIGAPKTPSSSSGTAAALAVTEQTSDQPAVTQTEAGSSSSPVDLSNKKSPEAESTTEAPSLSAATAVVQGKD